MPEDQSALESTPTTPTTSLPETPASSAVRGKRGEDFGPSLLPELPQFLVLARKVKQPRRLLSLIANVCKIDIPQELTEQAQSAKAALTPKQRAQLYKWLSQNDPQHLTELEKVSVRINVLTDVYGHQAVMALLDKQDSDDAQALQEPTDKWSRAVYLYLMQYEQSSSSAVADAPLNADTRFEQAERRQSMNQHWNSKDYVSHYIGPVGLEPQPVQQFDQALREQVAAIYPGIDAQMIVIDHHSSCGLAHRIRQGMDDGESAHLTQHTISAAFNATRALYKTVVGHSAHDAQVVEMDQPAAIEVIFAWEPATGMLSVFCPNSEHRPLLALCFQQFVLGQQGQPNQIPPCEFDLTLFANVSILQRISAHLVEGVQALEVQKIRICDPIRTARFAQGNSGTSRTAANTIHINRHSREKRDIYQVIQDKHLDAAIASDDISHVTLSLLMADQADCKAHRVAVHLARPNGLTHGCKTASDRQIMRNQLIEIAVMRQASF